MIFRFLGVWKQFRFASEFIWAKYTLFCPILYIAVFSISERQYAFSIVFQNKYPLLIGISLQL